MRALISNYPLDGTVLPFVINWRDVQTGQELPADNYIGWIARVNSSAVYGIAISIGNNSRFYCSAELGWTQVV